MVKLQRALDEADLGIIRALEENGRASDVEIGLKVGLKGNAVGIRRRKLEEAGLIKNYTIIIDELMLEYTGFWYLLVKLYTNNRVEEEEFEDMALKEIDILACSGITGEFDYMLYVGTTKNKKLEFFTKKIRAYSFVEKVISLHREEETKRYKISSDRIVNVTDS